MSEDEIRRELVRIAVSEIGKKNIASTSVKPDVDFDGGEALEVLVVLKPDAPSISGETYTSFLLRSYDFLHAQSDLRRPSLALDRASVASASTEK